MELSPAVLFSRARCVKQAEDAAGNSVLRPANFKADKDSKKLQENRKKPLDKRTPLG
jgi:hypothetical protein